MIGIQTLETFVSKSEFSCISLKQFFFVITGNGRVVFDFKLYSNLVPVNFVTGLEIDTNGLLYTVQAQSVWVINPW